MFTHAKFRTAIGLLMAAAPALAQFTPVATPTASYTGATTAIAISQPNFTSVSSITDGTQTITFSSNLQVRTVPGSWATWNSPPNTETATPRVVAALTAVTSFTLTLSVPVTTFGFEFEPNAGVHSVTATFMNGATVLGSVTRTVPGSSGALLFAGAAVTPITSVVLSVPAAASGWALAQLRYTTASVTSIPTLSSTGICGLGALLMAAGALLSRRQQIVA